MASSFNELASFIWSVADLLRGDFKQSEYGRVILPFTVLRRLDCVLAPTKEAALKEHAAKQAAGIAFEQFDFAVTGERLHKARLLYLVMEKFAGINPHPARVDNT